MGQYNDDSSCGRRSPLNEASPVPTHVQMLPLDAQSGSASWQPTAAIKATVAPARRAVVLPKEVIVKCPVASAVLLASAAAQHGGAGGDEKQCTASQ